MQTETETVTEKRKSCGNCGRTFSYPALFMQGTVTEIFTPRVCFDCGEAEVADAHKQAEREAARLREEEWQKICPPLYRDTNLADPRLDQGALKAVLEYKDQGVGRGLGLRGPTGGGKTRLAFTLLRRLFDGGFSAMAISATKLAMLCIESYDDLAGVRGAARERLRNIRTVRYLLIDDLGKSKTTERAEVEFYDLIETRTSHLRPTFWTCNMTSEDLLAKLGEDRGQPILRRLTDFSTVITTGNGGAQCQKGEL